MTAVTLAKACDWLGYTGRGRTRRLRQKLQRLEAKTGRTFLLPVTDRRDNGARYQVDFDALRKNASHLKVTQKREFTTELSVCFKKIDGSINELSRRHDRDVAELRGDIDEVRDTQEQHQDAIVGIVRRVKQLSDQIVRR